MSMTHLPISASRYTCLIGAQKSGTTSIYRYLAEHPEVHTIRWKESKFFLSVSDENQQRYQHCLQGFRSDKWLFETSTYYTKQPFYMGVPQRIHATFPHARLIYLVRDPIDRIWSQYCHYLARDIERRPFERAIVENREYVSFSRYYSQLTPYLDLFPKENVLVLLFEEFVQDKVACMKKIFTFLGVDADFCPPNLNVKYNDGGLKRSVSHSLRLIQSLPFYDRMPYRARKWLTNTLGTPLPSKASTLTPSVKQQLLDELGNDPQELADFLGCDLGQHWTTTFGRDSQSNTPKTGVHPTSLATHVG